MTQSAARHRLQERLLTCREQLVNMCIRLVQARSENPPGDTRQVAETLGTLIGQVEGASLVYVSAEAPIVNVVARLQATKPGRRLIFNGHLDTYPIGDPDGWTVDPLAGVLQAGRLYGRGVADMKGGLACSLMAFMLLAEVRDAWAGEVVLTFAGDEETMGPRGSQYVLDTVPYARGDAMICGDAGAPQVLRCGEKGLVWVDVQARGRAAHGAHVHLGDSAIERLTQALDVLTSLRRLPVSLPSEVAATIRVAQPISEALSGVGEAEVLQSITVNIGLLSGGSAVNLIADQAQASVDIRLPMGVSVAEVEQWIAAGLSALPGITYQVRRGYEPTWTPPTHALIRLAMANGGEVLSTPPVANMRVGASDARLYRRYGIPSLVCGLTPHNMGGPDEYIDLDDLFAVCYIHAMTAFDFLSTLGTGV